jgi:Zn-dependent peptidase ImmA (M78 family)/DNA-binding XRE family transcriptional regulator
MTVTDEQFGERIRIARERFHLTQGELGEFVDLSTDDIDAIERGERSPATNALLKIAYAVGRNPSEFFDNDFVDGGALSALFRTISAPTDLRQLRRALQEGIAYALQFSSLERMVGIDRATSLVDALDLPAPRTRDDAFEQGESIAAQERQRLRLGSGRLDRLQHLLETQGVGTMAAPLPDGIAGLMLCDPRIGAFVLFNAEQPTARRRLSLAHEYGHVLMDRHRLGLLSHNRQYEDLVELRADAFAAAFLMPKEGVQRSLGRAAGHDQAKEMAEGHATPGTPSIRMLQLAAVAQAFDVSRRSALRRINDLGLVSADDHDALREQDARGEGQPFSDLLGLFNHPAADSRSESRGRLMGLACEAYRLEKISRGKLNEIGRLVGVDRDAITRSVEFFGME